MFPIVFPNVFSTLFYNKQIVNSEDDDDYEEDEKKVATLSKRPKYIKNDFVESNKHLDDVSSFGLGGNNGEVFGDVSIMFVMCFLTNYKTCFKFETCSKALILYLGSPLGHSVLQELQIPY